MKQCLTIAKNSDNIILSKDNNRRKSGKAEPEGKGVKMSENMTDKQLEVIMNLVADKY